MDFYDDTCQVDKNIGTHIDPEKIKTHEKWLTTMKKIVWVCLINGIMWVWCSYILAALDKTQIAESLSQVAVTEIIGVVLVYSIKSLIENLSKNNKWPDKSNQNDIQDSGQ